MVGTVRVGSLLSSSLPVVVIDDSYTIREATSAWEERVEADEALEGNSLTEYIPAAEREQTITTLSEAFATGSGDGLTVSVMGADGKTHRDTYTVLPSSNTNGSLLCLVGTPITGDQQPAAAEDNATGHQDRTVQLERQRKQITRLHEVAVELAQCECADEVYTTMVEAAEDILSLEICLADAVVDGRLIVKATSSNVPTDGYREPAIEDAGMAGTVYQQGESALYNPQEHPDANPHDETFAQSLAVPIGTHGVFQATTDEPDAFDQTELELVELLCRHAREALTRIEQEQTLRERGQELELLRRIFGRIFRHNVRNELNIILSNAELISRDTTQDAVKDSAETITKSTDRLLSNTENAKQLDQLMRTSGDTIIVSLPSLVSRAIDRCREEYPDADISVAVEDIHVTVHPTITAAIETAIENSVTHNSDDVEINVSTAVDDRTVCLCIQDTGTGFPTQELEVINQENETSLSHSTGVGLWLIKWAVEKSGGSLTLRNTETGSCTKMHLPQAGY